MTDPCPQSTRRFQHFRYRTGHFLDRIGTDRVCPGDRSPWSPFSFEAILPDPDNHPPPGAEGDHYGPRLRANFRGPCFIGFFGHCFSILGDASNDSL